MRIGLSERTLPSFLSLKQVLYEERSVISRRDSLLAYQVEPASHPSPGFANRIKSVMLVVSMEDEFQCQDTESEVGIKLLSQLRVWSS